MRLRITWKGARQSSNPDALFGAVPYRTGIGGSFFLSVSAHAAVIWLAFSNLHFLPALHDYAPEIRRARVLELSVPISAPIIPRASEAVRTEASSRRGSSQARSRAADLEAVAASSVPAASADGPNRKFQMPPQVKQPPPMPTLVQVDLPPTLDLHQELRVPALAILAEANQRRIAKPFVAPPERKKTVEIPKDVTLDLRPPVIEIRAGRTKTPDFLARVSPVLPPPVGATAPVVGERQPAESRQAATVTGEAPSEPVTVISMPDRPIPAASSIVLPALNQVGPTNSGSGQSGLGNGNRSTAQQTRGEGAGIAANGSGKPGAAASGGSDSQAVALRGGGKAGDGAGDSPSGRDSGIEGGKGGVSLHGPGAGSASSGTGTGTAGNALSAGIQTPVARVVRPREGNYEVAVVQSSGGVPGTAGLLNGRPVYSVYLSVGTQRDWILQYCLPRTETRSTAPSNTVQIASIAPVSAPYVFLILRPSIHFRPGTRYGFIHGFVNESGRLEQLTEAGEPAIDDVATLVAKLAEWEFRPASKDGQPTKVEVLLCIPAAGT